MDVGTNVFINEVIFAPDAKLGLKVSCLERVLVSSVLLSRKLLLRNAKGWSELVKGFKDQISSRCKMDVLLTMESTELFKIVAFSPSENGVGNTSEPT